MNTQTLSLYKRARKVLDGRGLPYMSARESLRFARTLARFKELERDGLVRMRAEHENENYFDVFGEPDPSERNGHPVSQEDTNKELIETLDRDGVWWTCSEWRASEDDEWQEADSCGMHTGYKDVLSPWENCYVVDEMRAAIDAYEAHLDSMETEEKEELDYACRC